MKAIFNVSVLSYELSYLLLEENRSICHVSNEAEYQRVME